MEEIDISEFKSKCLAVIERIRKTRTPIRVTCDGNPIAEVFPLSPVQKRSAWTGSMKDSIEILGDIISPANNEGEMKAVHD